MDSKQWKAYGKIDPELEALIPHLPPAKSFADYDSVAECRVAVEALMAAATAAGISKPADFTGVSKREIQIPVRDGAKVRALIYKPDSGEPGPLFLYYHGGGWTIGGPEFYEPGFAVLTRELGFTVVGVDYRKAPEYLFPTAAYDSIDTGQWVAQNATQLGADPSKGFIVSGCSAGGNLATIVTHEAVDQKWSPPITGSFLSVPALVHPDAVPGKYQQHYNAWEDNKDALILDQRGMKWFYDQYKADSKSHLMSPLNWPSGHKTQPPTYLQICGMDPLRDDGLLYEYVLRAEDGVPTKLDVYAGIPHNAHDSMGMLSVAKNSLQDMKNGVEWLLSHTPRATKL